MRTVESIRLNLKHKHSSFTFKQFYGVIYKSEAFFVDYFFLCPDYIYFMFRLCDKSEASPNNHTDVSLS